MKTIFNIVIFTLSVVLVLYSGLMGVHAAAGTCAIIWGTDILNTALGTPPDRTHPAFILFILLIAPSMLLGFAGGIFLVCVPVFSKFKLRIYDSPSSLKIIRRLCSWYSGLLLGI
jgi:hypothetical protein